MKTFSLAKEFANIHHLEERVLRLSGLKLNESLRVFDVPIEFKSSNFIHTSHCGFNNKEIMTILHGYGGSGALNYPIMKNLSQSYQVYSTDLLGMGLSSRPQFDCQTIDETIDFFVESLEKWRMNLGLERFNLVGHSFGGYVACHYAIKYPERVKKLFMLSPLGMSRGANVSSPEEILICI